jgi:uncharacterized protein (TIGR01777 family)
MAAQPAPGPEDTMDVVVSGASGLIGTALGRSLSADGHRVIRLVRRPARQPEEIEWDPAAGRIDTDALEGAGAVVHLAGAGIADKRWSPARRREILESRTRGTALLAGALAKLDRPPAAFVSGSAVGYYGDGGDAVLTEESPPGDVFLSRLCEAWEAAAGPAVDAGIRTAFARTGLVLTPAGGPLAKLLPLFRLGLGGRMGGGREWWSWITLTDEVRAIRFLLDHEVAGPVNLTAPGAVRNAELTTVLGRVLHRPTLLPVPSFGPKLLLGADLAHQLLFLSQHIEPRVLVAHGFTFEHPDIETALRSELGRPD